VKTDVDGFPKEGEVTVEAFPEAQESIHHIRLSPSSGEEEGDYFFLILKTKADESDPPKPIAERRITGNREMPNQLIEILNLGDEDTEGRRELYKGYDKALDKHDLRAVEQLQTRGVPIIEPLDPGDEATDPVVTEDGTVITPGTPAVPPEEEGDTIKWRTIAERATQAQIKVVEKEAEEPDEDGKTRSYIQVEGNSQSGTYFDLFGGQIDYDDGLITGMIPPSITGKNLNLTINAKDYNSDGTINQPTEPPYAVTVLYWRNGLYVGDVDPADAPAQLDEQTVTLLQMGE